MWNPGQTAKKVFKRPGPFALAVIKQFRANQGVLLAGAVAYYTLLSLVPLLILILMALSHIIPEDRLLSTLTEYLEFIVPGQSNALVDEVRTFLAHKEVVGGILFVTMLFFSALAFTILENAMSVIFYHRVKIKRRHFLMSAVMPYLFILLLGVGLLIVTVLAGMLQFVGTRSITVLAALGNLFRLAGRTAITAPCADRWGDGHVALGSHASPSGLVLHHHVADSSGLRLSHHSDRRAIERGDRSLGAPDGRASDRRV
jgi:uncharacterized BrkB/YihY/UPF0761 family membrane protein